MYINIYINPLFCTLVITSHNRRDMFSLSLSRHQLISLTVISQARVFFEPWGGWFTVHCRPAATRR